MTRLSEAPTLHDDVDLQNTTLGRWTEIGAGSVLAQVEMGDYSYCARMCDFANVTIGKFANIASFVRIGATDHPLGTASLHHFLYRSNDYWNDAEADADWFARRRTRRAFVGHDTWIGHGAMVKPEVRVGHGAVIGAGAVVTKDVAPYTIVAGNPARVIRARQPEAVAERLIALAWWDWDHARLRAALDDFRSMPAEAFLERYEAQP
ncbi:MAG: chloramphenicol acetyltransferase [Shimia sp.]